jgi:hypothetical protein
VSWRQGIKRFNAVQCTHPEFAENWASLLPNEGEIETCAAHNAEGAADELSVGHADHSLLLLVCGQAFPRGQPENASIRVDIDTVGQSSTQAASCATLSINADCESKTVL